MADEEAEQDRSAQSGTSAAIVALRERLQELATVLKDSSDSPVQSASQYCQEFCQTLVEYADQWRIEEDPLPLVEVYAEAVLCYARASPCLSPQCENVSLVLERLTLSCVELLLSLPDQVPVRLWQQVQSSVQSAHSLLQENGMSQLCMLSALAQEGGAWANPTLRSILSKETTETETVHRFLSLEGPVLLEMRVKQLLKETRTEAAAVLAKACADFPGFEGRGHFKQTHLVCLCAVEPQERLMQELSQVDCRDALEMICNLESEGDEKGALLLCSAFLTRQLLQGDMYCAWELTLFWSKLLKRLVSSTQLFLDRCRQMSLLSKTVYHVLFLIKVVQSEMEDVGLPVCVEMCIRALQMESEDRASTKATICKTISCLLPSDLEVKRACQLTEFLLEPTVDSYYAVETLYNEPDQRFEEESLPVPNSLRCELLLVFKTQWPFDPEFWDWKTLKRHCLALMGEEASIVSSIDELNDGENPEVPETGEEVSQGSEEFRNQLESFWDATNELNEITDERRKKREIKKLREKGFISARFRNWQAYMQYCVLCDKEFLGHRIVRHAQTHFRDGLYSCPICTESFDSKEALVPHVASHVKQSCKERLAAMKASKKLANAAKAIPNPNAPQDGVVETQLKAKDQADGPQTFHNCGAAAAAKADPSAFRTDSSEEYTCPVANCRKAFKYYRNLMAHVKAHRNNDEARRFLEMQSKKVICQYCRRQFVSVAHLNDHLQVHCGVKPYICIQLNCNASFLSNAELLVHKEEHAVFKARCMFPSCGKVFNEAYLLYDHEAQHYKTFTCKAANCAKVFHSQSQLELHLEDHLCKEEPAQVQAEAVQPDQGVELEPQPLKQESSCSSREEPFHSASFDPEVVSDQGSPPRGATGPGSSSAAADEPHLYLPVPVKVKHSVESMLNVDPGPVPQSECNVTFKSEPPDADHQPFPSPSSAAPGNHPPLSEPVQDPRPPRLGDPSTIPLQRDPGQLAPQMGTAQLGPPYQSVTQDSDPSSHLGVFCGTVSSSQVRVPVLKVEQENMMESTGPVPAQHSGLFVEQNQPPGEQNQHCIPPPSAASRAVLPQPPSAMPRVDVDRAPSEVSPSCSTSDPVPKPQDEKQRHRCALETCTRDYSSYRSVTKHMKAAHPDFYARWKLAKKNSKVPKARKLNSAAPLYTRPVTGVPVPAVQMQIQPVVYPSPGPNAPFPSHPANVLAQTLPDQVENVLNPTLLSQLGNAPNQTSSAQSHVGPGSPWPSPPVNSPDLSRQLGCSAHVLPRHLQGLPPQPYLAQMSSVNAGMGHPTLQRPHAEGVNPFLRSEVDNDMRLAQVASEDGLHTSHMSDFTAGMNPVAPPQMDVDNRGFVHTAPASQVMPLNTNANPVLASLASEVESLSRSVLPSYLAGPKDPLLPDQLESSANHMFPPHSQTPSFSSFSAHNSMRPDFPPKGGSPSRAGANSCPSENGNVPAPVSDALAVKRTKRNKRAKWPAIIKDGKFICCRCFREFPSPKSLGGHLSKRSHCKAFDETDLSADLPTSFLDLLNSPHVLNAPQQPAAPNFNPSMPFKEPGQVLARGPLEPRFFPNVTFPQANGSPYIGDTEQNGEVLKQEMDNPAISNLYEQSGVPQPVFPSPSGSYPAGSRLPESTVIQHTGNMLIKTESEAHREDFMTNPEDPGFGSGDFPDHLISQMLAENNSAVSLSSLPTDHLNQILRAETLMKMREIKGSVADPPQSALSNDGLLAAMANLAQNLMTNPLLQITSPDPRLPAPISCGPQDDACNKKSEKSVKKKLREQILAGDLLRRSNASRAPATDGNVGRNPGVQHPPAVVPQAACGQQGQSSKVTGIAPEGELGAVMNSGEVVSVAPPQGEGALPVASNAHQSGLTPQEPGAPAMGGPVNADPRPDPSSAVEDAEVMEIQRALERLDLDKEVSADPQAVRDVSSVNEPSFSSAVSVTANALTPVVAAMAQDENFVKPFACENEGCNYRAMTKDALFKHLTKTHNYTREMINEIKKNHGKFAPFRCHMCNKTFTRNSNLRAHCQTVHGLSQDELVKLKIKRQNTKKAEKPEKEVGSDQVFADVNNPLCFQNAPPLCHQEPKESYTPQHADKSDLPLAPSMFYPEERTCQEYRSRSFVGPTSAGSAAPESSQENGLGAPSQAPQAGPTSCQAADAGVPPGVAVAGCPMEGLCSAPGPAAEHLTDWPEGSAAAVCGQYVAAPSEAGLPPAVASSLGPLQGDLLQAATLSPDKRPKVCKTKAPRPKPEKPKIESPKKAKEKKDKRPAVKNGEVDNTFSPYRPYRCVHQGCVAAFTIQQNLILHYKAVHQSALPRFELGNEEKPVHQQLEVKDEQLGEESQLKEFRCQVKDCSRIFQEVTGLLQHYLQLHKFTLDKAGALISSINLGRFQCDQPECATFFTAFWKYISHIEEDHKEASFSKAEPVEGLFRCEVEDCDRAYATRSNLLRHTMKKHHDVYKLQLMKQRKNQEREKQASRKTQLVVLKTSNGKENVQNNKKPLQKGSDKKKNDEEKSNHWTKYGKPSLKSKEEASAMCTKKFPLQYPCMIKGCESVVSSERNILRHYVRHGLSERYLEEQRSHFIFCKKFSRSRFRYWSKGRNRFEDSSTETSDNEDTPDSPEENETEDSKPVCVTDETAEDGETSDAKQSTDDGSEGKSVASAVVKRKRGRPRKGCEESTPLTRRKAMERLRAARSSQSSVISSWSDSTSSSGAAVATGGRCEQSVALSAFKPMGFEVSFLKFLEESAQSSTHPSKRKANEDSPCENPLKRTVQLKTATVLCKRSDAYVRPRDSQSSIDFRNPQNLSSLRNVKIVVDKAFSHVADLLLKQLQEMQPLVILQK